MALSTLANQCPSGENDEILNRSGLGGVLGGAQKKDESDMATWNRESRSADPDLHTLRRGQNSRDF